MRKRALSREIPPSDSELAELGTWHDGPADEPELSDADRCYRSLAIAVLCQAAVDASRSPGTWLRWRKEPSYALWCECAGVDPGRMYRAVMKRLCQGDVTLRRQPSSHAERGPKPGTLSPEARAAMGEASRKRWAAHRAAKELSIG
jgi:hypothetical protein